MFNRQVSFPNRQEHDQERLLNDGKRIPNWALMELKRKEELMREIEGLKMLLLSKGKLGNCKYVGIGEWSQHKGRRK